MPTEEERAEAVALAHQMGYVDGEAAARPKVERLETENKGLRKDNLELVNSLEGEGHRLERLEARVRELKAVLRGILRYKPSEVCKDDFAYDRMVAAYRKAARDALEGGRR